MVRGFGQERIDSIHQLMHDRWRREKTTVDHVLSIEQVNRTKHAYGIISGGPRLDG